MTLRTPSGPASRSAGFTLVELLIVVSIVAIMAMVAYPSYIEQIRSSRRADAQSVLMQAAQFMERLYSELACYNPGAANTTCGSGAPTLPYSKAPIDGAESYYSISVPTATASSYTLRATPSAGQSQEGTGNLEINNLGQKFWDKNADGDVTDSGEDSWSR